MNADSKRDGRYLVLTELFLPTKGGTAVWFAEVYRRLGGRGIHIVTAKVPGDETYDCSQPNTVHRLPLERVPWLKPESLGMYLRLLGRSLRISLCHRFESIHAGRALPEGLVAWLVARLTRHRVLIYAHGEELTTWGQGGKFKAMRFALRHADTVVANSDFTRELLVAMGVRPERIRLIHPGVDTARFRPGLETADLRARLGLTAAQPLVLTIGRLQRRKGFDMVIRAVPGLVERGHDVHCALVGIGEDGDYLRAIADELGVGDRVHLLGHVAPEDLPRWLVAADVFAMPNREIDGDNEGFGLVFLEAAACGKPVVAGVDGGTGSAVVDGKTGFRVDGKRLEDVEAAIARLLDDPALARRLGEAARQRALGEFDWQAVAVRTRAAETLQACATAAAANESGRVEPRTIEQDGS